jgi:type IV pilus assembly protein PilW
MNVQCENRKDTQLGLTLIELLIAVALGLMVSAAIFTVFVSSSRSVREDEQYRLMLESGRYAIKRIREDIRMVDFWGMLPSPEDITTALTSTTGSCSSALGLFDPGQALAFIDGDTSSGTPQFTPCAAITDNEIAGTDVLVVKRVSGIPTARTLIDRADLDGDGNTTETLQLGIAELQSGQAYLRTSATDGRIISDASATNPPALGESDWLLTTRAYFVRDHFLQVGDGIPSLCRLSVVGVELGNSETNTANQPECFVPNIEDFDVEFGLDANNDGIADTYSSNPTAAEMRTAVSVHLFVLARSPLSIAGYQNTKTYQLGSATTSGPYNDGFYRSLFDSTVALRNPINLSRLR